MEKKRYYILLSIAIISCILGIFFRFYRLDYKYLWIDEAITMMRICNFQGSAFEKDKLYTAKEAMDLLEPAPKLWNVVEATLRVTNQVPIYYISLRIWCEATSFSIFHLRLFSALFAALNVWLFFLLMREITSDCLAPLVGVAIISLSPLHILYAQEIRNYSMWISEFFLMNILFLRALKYSSWNRYWVLYSAMTTLALYTHGLTVLVIAIHCNYLLFFGNKQHRIPGIGSAMISCITFVPWLLSVNKHTRMDWMMHSIPWPTLVKNILFQITTNFFDITNDIDKHILLQTLKLFIALSLVFLLLQAILYAKKNLERSIFYFVLCTFAIIFIFPVTDYFGFTNFSMSVRYTFPAYWALHFFIAFYIGKNLSNSPKMATAVLGFILMIGLSSCIYHSQNRNWWNKAVGLCSITEKSLDTIRSSKKPLVIFHGTATYLFISFTKALPGNTAVIIARNNFSQVDLQNYSDYFVVQSKNKDLAEINRYKLKQIAPKLWHASRDN